MSTVAHVAVVLLTPLAAQWYTSLMFQDDDDIEFGSPASVFDKTPEQRRKEVLEKKLQKPVKETNKLKLSVLKQQLKTEGQKDDQTKQYRQQKEASKTFGTKTREQEIKQNQLDATTQTNPDLLVQQGTKDEKAKEEQQKSGEIQSEPA